MAVRTVRVVFPQSLVEEPLIFTVGAKTGVSPAIISASIASDSAEFVLRLQGTDDQIEEAVRLLGEKGAVTTVDDSE